MSLFLIFMSLIALSFLIAIHEAGHMMVAKWCGMRVLRYSIGFGPVLWKKTRGETTYQLAAIPFGGFVEIDGMADLPGEERENPGDPVLYNNHAAWKRILVIAAGPATNYLFAIVAAVIVFVAAGVPDRSKVGPLRVGQLVSGSPAATQGVKKGDIITHVDGRAVGGIDEFREMTQLAMQGFLHEADPKKRQALLEVDLEYARGGALKLVKRRVDPKKGSIGVTFGDAPNQRGAKVKGLIGAATQEATGLRAGDVVKTIGGRRVQTARQLKEHLILTKAGFRYVPGGAAAMTLWIVRGGKKVRVKVQPNPKDGKIGVVFRLPPMSFRRVPTGEAVTFGLKYSFLLSGLMLTRLGQLIGGDKEAAKGAGGPVRIVAEVKTAFARGWGDAIMWIIALSVLLGFFNILPIPALDGGRLVFRFVELFTGKRLSPEREMSVHRAGFFLLLILIVVLTFNDIKTLCFG